MQYRFLGDSGLLVSRVCLGTMNFGQDGWGCDADTSTAIVRNFIESGGNFIDTADLYAGGVSEEFLGRALRDHKREDLVIASKCYFRTGDTPNARGLSRKHIVEACEMSLTRLGLDYLDLYQMHGPDPFTSVEESMKALDDLVRQGKVRYLGCSNFHAWQFVKANGVAALHNYEKLISGQYMYNIVRRDVERDILPAAADQGMGLICWSPLASGFLTGKYSRAEKPEEGTRIAQRARMDMPRYWHDDGFTILDAVTQTAEKQNKTPSQIALAWLLHDRRVTAVIIGSRTVEQTMDNLVVGDWDLPVDLYDSLRDAVSFEYGYPQDWINSTYQTTFQGAEFPPIPVVK